MIRSTRRLVRKGQAMVEYALLVVCIAVVGAVAVSMLGHKTADTLAIAAAVMPGAHTDDNNPIQTSQVMPTTLNSSGSIVIDTTGLLNSDRYSNVLGSGGGAILVTAP